MNGNDMSPLRQYGVVEQELMEALSSVTRKDGRVHRLGYCPTVAELRRFVAGRCTQEQREEVLAHIDSCDKCIALLRQMRERIILRRTSLVLAVAAVLAVTFWVTLERSSSTPSTVANIDFRLISPTRGIDNKNPADAVAAEHQAGRLRIILPIGSEGKYECQILRAPQSAPLLRAAGEASLENHDVVLTLSVELGKLTPGRYSLALRREGSEWVYYPLILK
jgi:hypothetical protein